MKNIKLLIILINMSFRSPNEKRCYIDPAQNEGVSPKSYFSDSDFEVLALPAFAVFGDSPANVNLTTDKVPVFALDPDYVTRTIGSDSLADSLASTE